MADSFAATLTDKWTRMDRSILFIIIFIIAANFAIPVVFLIIGLGFERQMMLIILLVLTPLTLLLLGAYRQRRGMWLKRFNRTNDIVVRTIDGLLTKGKKRYRKRSLGKPVGGFPVNYVEIFELGDGDLLIKVEKQTRLGSIVEVGPAGDGNELQLDTLKRLMDEAFLPGGL